MRSISEYFEIVQITKPCALVDADYRERVYWRRDGVPLAGGYYVVSWPAGTKKKIFNEDAAFRGPYRTREDALGAMRELQSRALDMRRKPRLAMAWKAPELP